MKAKKCCVCGTDIYNFNKEQIADGLICPTCARICRKSMFANAPSIRLLWIENNRRYNEFVCSMTYHQLTGGYIYVDAVHRYCYLSAAKKPSIEPIVFKFSELSDFRITKVGQKTVTKTKGGIRRAVVGGALAGGVGAIVGGALAGGVGTVVGANTAKRETTVTGGTDILEIDLNISGIKTTISLANPPLETENVLNSIIEVQNEAFVAPTKAQNTAMAAPLAWSNQGNSKKIAGFAKIIIIICVLLCLLLIICAFALGISGSNESTENPTDEGFAYLAEESTVIAKRTP